ncbi:Hypothetical protein ERGA_CDS_03210 [Ehrlichia ruminantium str. Gardel]|nr:Hypothetical protein ERGA_CDS_03210 [Ehrlichia ruminantium str. Gardel]
MFNISIFSDKKLFILQRIVNQCFCKYYVTFWINHFFAIRIYLLLIILLDEIISTNKYIYSYLIDLMFIL